MQLILEYGIFSCVSQVFTEAPGIANELTLVLLLLPSLCEILQQELGEGAPAVHQLAVGPGLRDAALPQHGDGVRVRQVGDAVGYQDTGLWGEAEPEARKQVGVTTTSKVIESQVGLSSVFYAKHVMQK